MTYPTDIRTERLHLRRWVPSDREPFAALNADPQVMEYFPATLSRAESDAVADRIQDGFERRGFGFWAIEVPGVTRFAGFVGISVPRIDTHFTPCVEIGWRLAQTYWNKGYATEGARAALRFGFDIVGLDEIVSFTVTDNRRSRHVMEKIGMIYDPSGDFDHPMIAEGHPMRRHVLYRIRRSSAALGARAETI